MSKPEIRNLTADQLVVDPTLQRGLDQNRVARMVENFDPEAIGVLTVSRRENGTYHVVDGQHRREAARIAQGEKAELSCRVFAGLGAEAEARLFRLLNATAKPQAIDLFRIRVIEGEPVAVDVDRMLTAHGWEIRLYTGPYSFAAVAAADRLYRMDPAAVEKAIITITKAWGHDEADGRVFEGVGLVYARHGEAVELSNLCDRLSVFPGGQRALLGKARGLADLISTTVPRAVAEVVVELYNARRKTKALPAWRS